MACSHASVMETVHNSQCQELTHRKCLETSAQNLLNRVLNKTMTWHYLAFVLFWIEKHYNTKMQHLLDITMVTVFSSPITEGLQTQEMSLIPKHHFSKTNLYFRMSPWHSAPGLPPYVHIRTSCPPHVHSSDECFPVCRRSSTPVYYCDPPEMGEAWERG